MNESPGYQNITNDDNIDATYKNTTKEIIEEENIKKEKVVKENTARTVGLVMIIMLTGKITGLLRDIILNGKMGTEAMERIAFGPALTIPSLFLDFAFAAALSSSFIPVFNHRLEKKGKKDAFDLANCFITVIMIATTLIVIIAMLFAPQIISFAATGITDTETKALAAGLLKVMLPTIALTAAAFSLTGILQSLGEFNIPAAMSVLSNVIIITYFIFFYDKFGVWGLAAAFLAGWGTQIIIQVPSLVKRGYVYRPNLHIKNAGLKEIGVLMLPVIVSTWVAPINVLVNNKAASYLYDGEGMIILTVSNGFYSVITGVFILSIANVIFPKLSKQNVSGDGKAFAQTLNATLRVSAFLILPMSIGLCILSEPVIRLVYERGEFTAVSTERSSIALMCYSAGMLGLGFQTILSRAFYALKDAKTPLFTAIAAIIVNAVLSYALVKPLGVGGPALASGAAINCAGFIMLMVMIRRDKNTFEFKAFAAVAKMAVSAVCMGAVVFGVSNILPNGKEFGFIVRMVVVAVPVCVGVVVYMACAVMLKIDEAGIVFNKVRKLLTERFSGQRGKRKYG